MLEKQMLLGKPIFFAYVIIILKRNQNLAKKKKDRKLFNTPKQTSMRNLELFEQCSISAENI